MIQIMFFHVGYVFPNIRGFFSEMDTLFFNMTIKGLSCSYVLCSKKMGVERYYCQGEVRRLERKAEK